MHFGGVGEFWEIVLTELNRENEWGELGVEHLGYICRYVCACFLVSRLKREVNLDGYSSDL